MKKTAFRVKDDDMSVNYIITHQDIANIVKNDFKHAKFYSRCCKRCLLGTGDCAHDMDCYCHDEQATWIVQTIKYPKESMFI